METKGKTLRAIIYARTSSDDGRFELSPKDARPKKIGHKKSIELQIKACRELCKKEGYNPIIVTTFATVTINS